MNYEHDALTGLFNRGRGLAQLEQALGEAKQQGQTAAVLFADIEGFKQINEMLGHKAGDVVLCEFANMVQGVVSGKGTACRLEKDQFFVVLPLTSAGEAKQIAEQISNHLAKHPMHLYGGSHIVYLALTTGVASYPANGQDAESLLRAAEEAVLQSKKSGRQGTTRMAWNPSTTG